MGTFFLSLSASFNKSVKAKTFFFAISSFSSIFSSRFYLLVSSTKGFRRSVVGENRFVPLRTSRLESIVAKFSSRGSQTRLLSGPAGRKCADGCGPAHGLNGAGDRDRGCNFEAERRRRNRTSQNEPQTSQRTQ